MAPLFRFARRCQGAVAEEEIRCIADVKANDGECAMRVAPDDLKMQPCAGGLFLLDTGARGVPDMPFAG